jgi:DNA polymerase I-like protein with 3'-5' exonuclease and polymerase domains
MGRPANLLEYTEVLATLKGAERQWAKSMNMWWLYGAGRQRLSDRLSVRDLFQAKKKESAA